MRSKLQDLKLDDLLKIVNATYIAERFFGKPGSWLTQKLDENDPSGFTPEERETLAEAIDVLAIDLMGLSDDLR